MTKDSVVREIISDFHHRDLPEFTRRAINLACPENKIRSLVGVRRSGKTFLFNQLIHDLVGQGVEKERILFINFEDERLLPLDVSDLSLILNQYYEMFPAFKDEKVFAFFDEIQNVPNWENFVRRIHDSENISVNVTGSSSKLLSREIATSLRGRTLSFEVFPFSFPEFLRCRGVAADYRTSKMRSHVVSAFETYFTTGGFPECAKVSEEFRVRILQDYFNLILYKDLIERHDIRNHGLIKYLIKFLLTNDANPFSVNRFYNDLKSQGYRCSKDTLHNYLSFLEDAHCFSFVSIYSHSFRKSCVNYRKVYAVDHGLVNAISRVRSPNTGRVLESMTHCHLRRSFDRDSVFYHRTSSGKEIDFLVLKRGAVSDVIQVCETIADPKTRSRECDALWLAMEELDISHATIVTRNERDVFKKGDRTIQVIPFWTWALETG